MARDEHNKAAEHHENAAKSHRAAAEHVAKAITQRAKSIQQTPATFSECSPTQRTSAYQESAAKVSVEARFVVGPLLYSSLGNRRSPPPLIRRVRERAEQHCVLAGCYLCKKRRQHSANAFARLT